MVRRPELAALSGRLLGRRYELGALIGEGGMASIFRGTDRLLGRTVAVKILAPRFAQDHRFVTRFQREARTAAGLNHPNVVSVFDTGSDEGVNWIVMEHVDGKPSSRFSGRRGPARSSGRSRQPRPCARRWRRLMTGG
jgi:serine/threonine-protein kinase